ncbi:hypothetical protein AVEN_88584-1 [Araneus ventricosus]|uniref:Uncharacterized protein n=1 Tax=Araneus ventricosus TaxID=182803 RepID=A0A4Y2QKL8_ARAVE|nr:hypothetical protein AVEN_88584-1 [Araneus ventricosus]
MNIIEDIRDALLHAVEKKSPSPRTPMDLLTALQDSCPIYDEEFTRELLGAIKEERKREFERECEKEDREREREKEEREREREREREEHARERDRAFELQKLELVARDAREQPVESMQILDQPVKSRMHDVM